MSTTYQITFFIFLYMKYSDIFGAKYDIYFLGFGSQWCVSLTDFAFTNIVNHVTLESGPALAARRTTSVQMPSVACITLEY